MKKRCLQCMNEFDAEYNICPHCGYAADSTDRGTDHIKTGSVIQNRYLIGKVLGSGGFGITYVAWDNNLEEKVAIKEYFPRDLSSRVANTNEVVSISEEKGEMYNAGLRKFIEEARLLAKFKAVDGIVNVENYFEENNTAYIVMEFAEGITLNEYLKSRGRLTDSETIKLMLPIMSSLEQIHKRGIIHRDISPENIMINGEKVKLLDFGAARFATGGDNRSLSIVLKHGYAPEEQYRTKGVQGAWTDIYSLCATMYKCITGTVPDESFERILDDTLKAPSELGIYIKPNLERVIMKGLNVKAADRYQSITEMVADLNAENDEGLAETVALDESDYNKSFRDNSSAEKISDDKKLLKEDNIDAEKKKDMNKAFGFRIGAIISWTALMVTELFSISPFQSNIPSLIMWILYLICIPAGFFLWKKANSINPSSNEDKTELWFQNNILIIVSICVFVPNVFYIIQWDIIFVMLLAFVPFIVLSFSDKSRDIIAKVITAVVTCLVLFKGGWLIINIYDVSTAIGILIPYIPFVVLSLVNRTADKKLPKADNIDAKEKKKRKKALGFRIGAIAFWVVYFVFPYQITTLDYSFLQALYFVWFPISYFLWKKADTIYSSSTNKNGVKRWIRENMLIVASLFAYIWNIYIYKYIYYGIEGYKIFLVFTFAPFILLSIKDKREDKKAKLIAAIAADGVLLAGSLMMCSSYPNLLGIFVTLFPLIPFMILSLEDRNADKRAQIIFYISAIFAVAVFVAVVVFADLVAGGADPFIPGGFPLNNRQLVVCFIPVIPFIPYIVLSVANKIADRN